MTWYKHVGAATTINADMGKEVATRCAVVGTIARSLSAKIFRNPLILIRPKIILMNSLIMSRQRFQCGTWPLLSKAEYNRFAGSMMRLYRMLLPACNFDKNEAPLCDTAVLDKLKLMHPAVLLRFSRMRTFFRTVRKADEVVWQILFAARSASRSWMKAVLDDILWLKQCGNTFDELPSDCLGPWFPFIILLFHGA